MQRRLAIVMMVTTGAALFISSAGHVVEHVVDGRHKLVEELSAEAHMIAARSDSILELRDGPAAQELLAALRSDTDMVCAALYTADGRLFAHYLRAGASLKAPPPTAELEGHYFDNHHLYVFARVLGPGKVKIGTAMVCADMRTFESTILDHITTALILTVVGGLLALLLTSRLRRLISDPFLKLTQVARDVVQKRDFTVRAPKSSDDEAGQLVDAFNAMLVQIQQRDDALRKSNESLEKRVQERTQLLQRELIERMKTEENLWESQRTLTTLMSNLPGAAYRCKNDHDRTMILVSEGIYELTGFRPADLVANAKVAYAKLIHPKDKEMVWNEIQNGVFERKPFQITYRILAADGKERWVWEQGLAVYSSDGEFKGLEGFITDITQRKRIEEERALVEEQLRQVQKMEAVGRLAGGVAHDFNNILTVITGYCDMLLRRTDSSDPLHKNVDEISKAASRASALTRQLLAFSRKQVLQPKVLELNGVVVGMQKMLCRLIGEDVELRTSFMEGLGSVKADPGQVEQVIMNLAVNARDAMPQGGVLTIETANVVLTAADLADKRDIEPGNFVMLSVSDTGVGMTDAVKAHLFEPFFTTKGPGKGTGLGLATCYGIIRQSGGHINVSSEPDRGTTFRIYLPRVDESLVTEQSVTEEPELPNGTEVLLMVEDEAAVRELSALVLRECGYEVLEAGNGQEGLQVASAHHQSRISLVISDIIMPQMGGQEMVEQLRKSYPDMKVLFTSGYTDDALVSHGGLDRNVAFLEKPFSPKQLAKKVRQVLDESQAVAV